MHNIITIANYGMRKQAYVRNLAYGSKFYPKGKGCTYR